MKTMTRAQAKAMYLRMLRSMEPDAELTRQLDALERPRLNITIANTSQPFCTCSRHPHA